MVQLSYDSIAHSDFWRQWVRANQPIEKSALQ